MFAVSGYQFIHEVAERLLPRGLRKEFKIRRAQAFESFGSDRFSHPSLDGIEQAMADRLPAQGVFLEVGANDGITASNTYHLERLHGWEGILIEPLPDLFERCQRLRSRSKCFNVACTSVEQSVQMADMDMDAISVALGLQTNEDECRRVQLGALRSLVNVPGVPISKLIHESGFSHIDFMCVDVEGAELALLGGLDFDVHCPDWLLVETDYIDEVVSACSPHMVLIEKVTHHD